MNSGTELRILVGNMITAQYSIAPAPNVVTNDVHVDSAGVSPLIKIYPQNAPATLRGLGAGYQKVSSHITIDIKCRNQSNAFQALCEVVRILGHNRLSPFSGYDLIEFDQGTYRGGGNYMFFWVVEANFRTEMQPVAT